MSDKTNKGMVLAAAHLARSAPQQWDEFVAAFAEYADDRIVDVIQSSPDMLQTTQGRAQGLVAFGKLLDTCRKMAESIANNDKPR